MSEKDATALVRLPTGIPGVDAILRGGLFKGGIYIVSGVPGSGKTIFANQICSNWVAQGKRGLYVTLLAETHGRMLAQMRTLTFFDPSKLGTQMKYLNGFSATESGGLEGLLNLVRGAVREHQADILVLDGMITASALAKSAVDYKKFINELQTWVAMLGCTVLFLTSTGTRPDMEIQPEHTMVDGIFELSMLRTGVSAQRRFVVTKFRASAFTEGVHNYIIRDDGITVFPRLEAGAEPRPPGRGETPRMSLGIKGLDTMIGGGVSAGSCTLILGPSGAGKTIFGLQFLVDGVRRNEKSLHFGLFERPRDLCTKGDRLGFRISEHLHEGSLRVIWYPPAELVLDRFGYELLDEVDRLGITRVFIDGLAGLKSTAPLERFPGFFSTLVEALGARGVTMVMTEETRELFVQEVEVPTQGVSAIFHNILFVRHVDDGTSLSRVIAVMKTRDSAHDRRYHAFEISADGIHIGKPLKGDNNLASGSVSSKPGRFGRKKRR